MQYDEENEFEDLKKSLFEYMEKDPHMTWAGLEQKLREANAIVRILPEKRITPPNLDLVNNQRQGNMRYEIVFVRNPRIIARLLKDDDAKKMYANRINEAGILKPRRAVMGKYDLPEWHMNELTLEQQNQAKGACKRCGSLEHKLKECTEEKEPSRIGECFKCGEKAIELQTAQSPIHACLPAKDAEKRDTKSRIAPSPTQDKHSLAGDAERKATKLPIAQFPRLAATAEGHKSFECPEPRKARPMKCYNCGEEGHSSRDCSNPKVEGLERPQMRNMTCYNCGEEGHRSSDCTAERKERGSGGGGRNSDRYNKTANDGWAGGIGGGSANDDWGTPAAGGADDGWGAKPAATAGGDDAAYE
ncbi:hypothetical protein HDV05_008078, partial [Chytridiales sp. JEL 0842]